MFWEISCPLQKCSIKIMKIKHVNKQIYFQKCFNTQSLNMERPLEASAVVQRYSFLNIYQPEIVGHVCHIGEFCSFNVWVTEVQVVSPTSAKSEGRFDPYFLLCVLLPINLKLHRSVRPALSMSAPPPSCVWMDEWKATINWYISGPVLKFIYES